MSFASRGTRVACRNVRRSQTIRQPRRCASSGHGHDHAHGHGESALHLPDANPKGNESLGIGFYFTLAAVPVFYVGYSLAYGSSDNVFATQYQKFKEGKKDAQDKDLLHQTVIAQAVQDRARMNSFPRESTGPDLRYPEMFNAGSPWNQAAGESGANMQALEEFMHKKNAEIEEERLARIENGKVKSVYDAPR